MLRKADKKYDSIVAEWCHHDNTVIEAFKKTPREKFLDEAMIRFAYIDDALPIGYGQTISKPSTVAYMTYLLQLKDSDVVLEIGTGSGFQTAVLARIAKYVFTVERITQLHQKAYTTIRRMGINNVKFKIDNGHIGWEENAPYDKIIVTAEGIEIPPSLIDQLKPGGRLIIPVNGCIKIVTKDELGVSVKEDKECKFVEFVK